MIAVNLGFGFLAVWNLAYLGCLFDSNPEVEEKVCQLTTIGFLKDNLLHSE